jgi:hypothetical protein
VGGHALLAHGLLRLLLRLLESAAHAHGGATRATDTSAAAAAGRLRGRKAEHHS